MADTEPNHLPRPRWLLPVTLTAVVLIVAASLYLWQAAGLFGGQGSVVVGGPFSLVDQHAKPVTEETYRGRLMLVYFGYTYCPDVCPTTLARIGQALDQLSPEERKQIAPVFITIDPARDTPAQLAQYVPNFHPDLIGLTGSAEEIGKVEKEYRVYAKRVDEPNGTYSMDHSSILYVMGKNGKFRGIIADTAAANEIANVLKGDL
jgi:protein SCO1/2